MAIGAYHGVFSDEQKKVAEQAEKLLSTIEELFVALPSTEERAMLTETMCSVLLRMVPLSGITIQQRVEVDAKHIDALGLSKSSTPEAYVYKFAREATSAGIVPAYRESKTGDIYVGLICNKRNEKMFNWSAGYSEVFPPRWSDQLKGKAIQFDRSKILAVAQEFMKKTLAKANGDWTKVHYDAALLENEFKDAGITLPPIDFNSEHTASRELKEETCLDDKKYPTKKRFLVSYDNTLGISQGDAPGQTSNRSHQFFDYLGELDAAPELKGNDDVAIAEWANVSAIQRMSPTEYKANGKPLSVYMLRGLETGIKMLWSHLLQEASSYPSPRTGKTIARFSEPENLATAIELFCSQHKIEITKDSSIALFLSCLTGDLPGQTYTGRAAQQMLNCMVTIATTMTELEQKPKEFYAKITEILAPFVAGLKAKDETPVAIAPSATATVLTFEPRRAAS